jgi:multiple sugar transport system permease protein
MTRSMNRRAVKTILYLPVTLSAVAALLPLYWLLTGSIKTPDALLRVPPEMIPHKVTGAHLEGLFEMTPAARWLVNSIVVALITTASNVILCSMAGYGFAKLSFPGRRALFWMCLGTMMVPAQVTVIPLFIMVRSLGLIDTYAGLVLPSLTTAFGIFLMKQFLQSVPDSVIEAARIDGSSEFMIFWRIIFPLAKPAVAVLAILSFTSSWNSFLWPLLVAVDDQLWTLPVGIASLNSNFFKDYGLTMAGAAVAAVPMIVLFVALQKYFIKGLTVGAVKG